MNTATDTTGTDTSGTEQPMPSPVPAPTFIAGPQIAPVETVTLGRQPNNAPDGSGAMWFE